MQASSLAKSPFFYCVNRGKMSVVLDLKTESGRAGLFALLEVADVFLSNYRQPPLEKLGLGAESLARRFPRLVVCAMTGYGRKGPDAALPGYDVGVFYARSGLASAFHPTHPK
jgi:cinnamoyl-CoA:phenyllactate CoA-transferase